MVSVLDSGAEGPRFKSQSRRCRVTVLGKLFTPIVSVFTKQQIGSAALLRAVGYLQAWRKVMAAYRQVYDSHHLQADCQELGLARGTLRSVTEYGLHLCIYVCMHVSSHWPGSANVHLCYACYAAE